MTVSAALAHTGSEPLIGSPIPILRRVTGVVRLAAALLLVAAFATQITDLVVHDEFRPHEYFTYFTIESNLMNIVVFAVGGVMALRRARDTPLLTSVRVSLLSYSVITGLVFNIMLRNLPPHGFQGIQWPAEVMHVVIPIFVVLDWVLAPGRPRVAWRALWLVASYPVLWIIFTMIRGALTGWYPYPFLEPGQPGGYLSVLTFAVVMSGVLVGLSSLGIAISRIRRHARVIA